MNSQRRAEPCRRDRSPAGRQADSGGDHRQLCPGFRTLPPVCARPSTAMSPAWRIHYILVEHRDVALFRQLENGRRASLDERDLLRAGCEQYRRSDEPVSAAASGSVSRPQPLRGWHVQQLRRIAIAASCARRCAGVLRFRRRLRQTVRHSRRFLATNGKVRLFQARRRACQRSGP